MDKHKLDSDIKAIFENSKDYYEPMAQQAKARIWENIQQNEKKKYPAYLLRILAIACILLILLSSGLSLSLLNSRRTLQRITDKNSYTEKQLSKFMDQSIAERIHVIDTVVVTEKEYIDRPVFVTQILTDTVFIKEIVYMPEDVKQNIISEDNTPVMNYEAAIKDTLSFTSEVLIRNMHMKEQAREPKMKIKLFNMRDNIRGEAVRLSMKL